MVRSKPPALALPSSRLLFLDALRAVASVVIVWHHFALYPPLATQAEPLLGPLVDWFRVHARATQVFFVVGGFVMARSLSGRTWNPAGVGAFIAQRYCRLGLPYLAAIAVAIAACSFGRAWLPASVVGQPPTISQLLAHAVFAQDLLEIEPLSAGLWFVCINFQLGLIYVATLALRDALARWLRLRAEHPWIDVPVLVGWVLSGASLFYFNVRPEWDATALYFYPHFFMGIIVHRALRDPRSPWIFWLYLLLVAAGVCFAGRWRLISALVVGLLLFGMEKSGLGTRWPRNRAIASLGRVSYSLFLIHFPLLVLVAGAWTRLGWDSPASAIAGLLLAFIASVGASFAFHRFVEVPSANLARRWMPAANRTRTPEAAPEDCSLHPRAAKAKWTPHDPRTAPDSRRNPRRRVRPLPGQSGDIP